MAGGDEVAGTEALQARIAALESELEQARAELHAHCDQESWFKGLVEIAPDAMLVHGPDRKIVYVNPAGVRLFGATSEDQIVGTLSTSFIHPEFRLSVDNHIEDVLTGVLPSSSITEQRRLRLDGTDYFADVTAIATLWEDKPASLVVVRDVSERMQARAKYESAEEGHREAHTRLLDAIEAMSEGFALYDAEDRLQMFNRQFVDRFSGIPSDFIQPGMTFDEILDELRNHRSFANDYEELKRRATERHRNLPSDAEIRYDSGLWIRQTKKRTRDGGVVAIYADITDLKSREQALRESELRHRQMLEALPDATTIHQDDKLVFVNAAAVRLLGAKNAEELIGQDSYQQVPPELVPLQKARRAKVLKERCTVPPVEQWRLRPDGSFVAVETVSSFILWQGRPAVVGVLRDISARKEAAAMLAETERRLSVVTDHIPGAVYERVQSPEGKISFSFISAGVREATGLSPEDITEDASRFIACIREDFRNEYRSHFKRSAENMVPSNIEFPITRPDGSQRWLHTTGRPMRRPDGSVVWDGIMIDVTEKMTAQEIAERNYQWFLQAISSMPVGFMLWNSDDRLVLWNEYIVRYHPDPTIFREGLSFEEMMKLPYEDMRGRLGKDAADEWMAERRHHHKSAKGNHEFQGVGNVWFTLRERRTPDGFTVTLLSDVSERHESRNRLFESEKRYRTMINMSPDAIYVHRKGQIMFCNEAAVKLFRATSADQLIGRDLLELTHPEYREAALRMRRQAADQGTLTLSMRQKRLRLDGSWFWAQVSAAAIDWEGDRGGVVVLREISDQIAAEEELIRSKEEADLANRAKTEFLANISHELRTPLNAIIGFSDLMQQQMLGPLGNEQYNSYIRDIHQSGTHLHDLINDILDLSKIEAGQMELHESSVNLKAAIKRCIRLVSTRVQDNGLKLVTKVPEKLPFLIADETKLKQILINLLSNAVKFTETGGTVTIEATAEPHENIIIRVTDTGIGIAAKDIPKAFRAFEQVDSALSRTREGTGLGLPLTKSLVELHNGTLELESKVGVGTTATVQLPAERITASPAAAE